jgi:hypothetical protein
MLRPSLPTPSVAVISACTSGGSSSGLENATTTEIRVDVFVIANNARRRTWKQNTADLQCQCDRVCITIWPTKVFPRFR